LKSRIGCFSSMAPIGPADRNSVTYSLPILFPPLFHLKRNLCADFSVTNSRPTKNGVLGCH
jgi:hypothetical protein